MRRVRAVLMLTLTVLLPPARAAMGADPTFSINVQGRDACSTPSHSGQARVDGGTIDVQNATSNSLNVIMSGAVAANAFLGCPGEATQRFRIVQEFDFQCSDPNVVTGKLTFDSAVVGFVRSRYRAGAGLKLATARLFPLGQEASALVLTHPALCVDGTAGQICNQHLPPIQVSGMPIGRYILVAEFQLAADAAGLRDAHAVADFSPTATFPTDWVRTRDPFQGADKKNFGHSITISMEYEPPLRTPAPNAFHAELKTARVSAPARPAPAQAAPAIKRGGVLEKPAYSAVASRPSS